MPYQEITKRFGDVQTRLILNQLNKDWNETFVELQNSTKVTMIISRLNENEKSQMLVESKFMEKLREIENKTLANNAISRIRLNELEVEFKERLLGIKNEIEGAYEEDRNLTKYIDMNMTHHAHSWPNYFAFLSGICILALMVVSFFGYRAIKNLKLNLGSKQVCGICT